MSVFELFTGIWRFEEGAFFVAELPRCIISPVQKSTIVKRAYAMAPAALYVVDEKRLVCFVEKVREVGREGQVLNVRSSIDAQRSFKIVPAAKHLLVDEACLLAVCDDHTHLFAS